jgi:hypothetical protein
MINPHLIPQDKAKHFAAGVLVFIVAGAAMNWLGHPAVARPAGVLGAVCVALAKEFADAVGNELARRHGRAPPHRVEFADLVATMLGAAACWAAAVLTES